MQKTYRLAKVSDYIVKGFGPLHILDKALAYQADMERAGFPVVVINVREGEGTPNYVKALKRAVLLH